MPATWGSACSAENVPPPKSSTKNCDSAGVVVRARLVDQRPQQRALAAARTADDRDMAAGAGEVDGEGVAALLTWPVDRADRHGESAERPPPLRDQPELGVGRQVGQQRVEGVGPSSGGSQTWCAVGPRPAIRRTAAVTSDSCPTELDGVRLGLGGGLRSGAFGQPHLA